MPILATLLLAITTSLSATQPAAVTGPPKIGQPAPTFTLRDQNGKRISFADAAGTKVVLIFYRGYW